MFFRISTSRSRCALTRTEATRACIFGVSSLSVPTNWSTVSLSVTVPSDLHVRVCVGFDRSNCLGEELLQLMVLRNQRLSLLKVPDRLSQPKETQFLARV